MSIDSNILKSKEKKPKNLSQKYIFFDKAIAEMNCWA